MSIRLRPPATDPYWIDVGSGVKLQVRPPTTPLVYAAREEATALLVQLIGAGTAATKAGGQLVGLDLESERGLAATKQSLFVVALGEMAIVDWRGVLLDTGDDDDRVPLPFEASHVANLFLSADVADRFLGDYYKPLHEVVSEGNV